MKNVIFSSIVDPSVPGYMDRCAITDDTDKKILWHGYASCCPNPNDPKNNRPYFKSYGWISPATYSGECVDHAKYKKSILLENGGSVSSRIPNARHEGAYCMDEIFIHAGQNNYWRGSAGCLTLSPDVYDDFISNFEIGEKVKICVIDRH